MKANNLIPLFAAVIVVFCSCKKGATVNTPVNNPVYLTKVVDTFFLSISPNVFSSTSINYHYDNLNRLAAVAFVQSTSNIFEIYSDSTVYYYNGADTLPFKAVCTDRVIGPVGTMLEYYTYDAQSRISKYISMSLAAGIVSQDDYTYTSNQIIVQHFGDTTVSSASFDTLAYNGNNITQDIATDTSFAHLYRAVFNIQSSNVENPFNLVNINRHKPYRPSGNAQYHSIYEPISGIGQILFNKNAVSTIAMNGQTGIQNYQYDVANGLPGKALITGNSAFSHTVYFYYR